MSGLLDEVQYRQQQKVQDTAAEILAPIKTHSNQLHENCRNEINHINKNYYCICKNYQLKKYIYINIKNSKLIATMRIYLLCSL